MPIVSQRVRPDSVVYADGLPVYGTLDAADFEHHRVDHAERVADEAPHCRQGHTSGIENFPPTDGGPAHQPKRHFRRYDKLLNAHLEPFLGECEWRFNYRTAARAVLNRPALALYLGQSLTLLGQT